MTLAQRRTVFLRKIAPDGGIAGLFDILPDISVFMKDARGRFMFLNPRGCEYCGVASPDDAFGKTDLDFFPSAQAARYRADDRRVMADGVPMLNRVEPEPGGKGVPRLVVTSKLPLRETRASVAEVAQTCGFYDQAHFCRAFSAAVGCAPLAYRRRHQTA